MTATNRRNEDAWDSLSDYYQANTRISLENYHYNPYGPGDNELKVIGDVTGLDVLEVGCGGGQNSIVLSKQGAKSVTGLDQSVQQLDYARELAKQEHVEVSFLKSDMEKMSMLEDSSYDLIVSSHAMNYASDIHAVFRESYRVLRFEGRIITCMAHPVWLVVGEALEENDISKIANYFQSERETWEWHEYRGKKIGNFETTPWTLGDIINGLIDVGFIVQRIDEPKGYTFDEVNNLPLDAVPYRDKLYTPKKFIRANTIVPNSIIITAMKKNS